MKHFFIHLKQGYIFCKYYGGVWRGGEMAKEKKCKLLGKE